MKGFSLEEISVCFRVGEFFLRSVNGTTKKAFHIYFDFLLREQKVAQVISGRHFDKQFTLATERCERFALLVCGPGKLCSIKLSFGPRDLRSLPYARLGDHWSKCIARIVKGGFEVVLLYHRS